MNPHDPLTDLLVGEAKPSGRTPRLISALGNDYSWGRMIGAAEAEQIQAAERVLEELPLFRLAQPWWLPYSLYLYYAERAARLSLESPLGRIYPGAIDRLRGMAEGAGVRLETLFLFHMLEAASSQQSQPRVSTTPMGGCTAMVFGAEKIDEHHTVMLHNLDQVSQAAQFLTVRESAGEGELRSVCLTLSPLCGVVDGMNEAGLAISYNYAAAVEVVTDGTPVSLAISDALAHATSVSDALARITQHPRKHGAMLMLADASGAAARLELSGAHHHVEWLSDPGGMLYHSNSYRASTMHPHQVAADCTYGDQCPAELRGSRILESSELRDARIESILNDQPHWSLQGAQSFLHDHGAEGEGNANTICMHGPYWSTIASVRMFPEERVFSVAYGPACQSTFYDFTL